MPCTDLRSEQRLASAVRRVKACHWLSQMALEIGFCDRDLHKYRHRKHTYVVPCKGGADVTAVASVTEDASPMPPPPPPPGDSRRGAHTPRERVVGRRHNQPWLVPVITSTVVEETQKKMQMFMQVRHCAFVCGRSCVCACV